MVSFHYTQSTVAEALHEIGVQAGDTLLIHSDIGRFGFPDTGQTREAIMTTLLAGIFQVIGNEGTLVVPTFTYSFAKRAPFNVQETPSTVGAFSEAIRQHPDAKRSHDPLFSVAAIGKQAEALTAKVGRESFGAESVWERLHACNAALVYFNVGLEYSTFVHYVEKQTNVAYRYDKIFTGTIIDGTQSRRGAAVFFCRDVTNPDTLPRYDVLNTLMQESGVYRTARVGRGAIGLVRTEDFFTTYQEALRQNPYLPTEAGQAGRKPVLIRSNKPPVTLPENASIDTMVAALWPLKRDIVSDGYDAALEALATQIPMTIHEYPTGERSWTWIVPEKWTCQEAYLETLDGQRLFSYADHPLHVVSYSLPIDRVVERDELLDHLHTHPYLDDAVPFIFKYYDRDWGLCCTREQKERLTDDHYHVKIDTAYSYHTLKVGEVILPGETDETFVLCAHLCHPAMVNDDIVGVAVAIDVMRHIQQWSSRHYTYRLIILPETIGSVTYLSHNEHLVPNMIGGLFLEMVGLDQPHALQLSFTGQTEIDRCFTRVFQEAAPDGWIGAFRTVIGNDERQFNAPGMRVPMLSLSRVRPKTHNHHPYPQYHSNQDSPEITHSDSLIETRDLTLRLIEALEGNQLPVNNFRGEVFMSGVGMHIDYYTNPEGNKHLFNIMYLIDGTRTIAQIAEECNISFQSTRQVIDKLAEYNLVTYRRPILKRHAE